MILNLPGLLGPGLGKGSTAHASSGPPDPPGGTFPWAASVAHRHNFNDSDTIFQDTAGTEAVTAHGQDIFRINDTGDGGGGTAFHLQEADTSRTADWNNDISWLQTTSDTAGGLSGSTTWLMQTPVIFFGVYDLTGGTDLGTLTQWTSTTYWQVDTQLDNPADFYWNGTAVTTGVSDVVDTMYGYIWAAEAADGGTQLLYHSGKAGTTDGPTGNPLFFTGQRYTFGGVDNAGGQPHQGHLIETGLYDNDVGTLTDIIALLKTYMTDEYGVEWA